MRIRIILALIFFSGISCANATDSNQERLQKIIDLCTKEKFPNSMARPEGFNMDKYMDELHKNLLTQEKPFYTKEGIKFLTGQLGVSQEDIDKTCISEILSRAKNVITK